MGGEKMPKIDNAEHCVCCGQVIPEGSQYCVICGYKAKHKKTNYDRIRNMSVEELAEFIHFITPSIAVKLNGEYVSNEIEYIKQYLESECDTE
jgi:predicted nucleic acid-binding Zn ribbon protein